MAVLSGSSACLRFFGDALEPDHLTRLLGSPPTAFERKGAVIVGKVTGRARTARTGGWRLRAKRREPSDLDAQISEILDQLTDERRIWRDLTERFSADMFCGLFTNGSNEGVALSHTTLQRLAWRGLSLDFDIYSV